MSITFKPGFSKPSHSFDGGFNEKQLKFKEDLVLYSSKARAQYLMGIEKGGCLAKVNFARFLLENIKEKIFDIFNRLGISLALTNRTNKKYLELKVIQFLSEGADYITEHEIAAVQNLARRVGLTTGTEEHHPELAALVKKIYHSVLFIEKEESPISGSFINSPLIEKEQSSELQLPGLPELTHKKLSAKILALKERIFPLSKTAFAAAAVVGIGLGLAYYFKSNTPNLPQDEDFWAVAKRDNKNFWAVAQEYKESDDYENALIWYRKGAENCDANSMDAIKDLKYLLHIPDSDLDGIENAFKQDCVKKAQLMAERAAKSNREYHYRIAGGLYELSGDYKNAFIHLRKSAEKGNEHSMNAIEKLKEALHFSGSILVPYQKDSDNFQILDSDVEDIHDVFKQARYEKIQRFIDDGMLDCEMDMSIGCESSFTFLGSIYEEEIGDYKNALILYRRVAENGGWLSLHAIREIEELKDHIDISDSDLESIRITSQQARDKAIQGLIDIAQKSDSKEDWATVGNFFWQGGDYENAFIYYRKAAENGSQHSMDRIENLKKVIQISNSDLWAIYMTFLKAILLKDIETFFYGQTNEEMD